MISHMNTHVIKASVTLREKKRRPQVVTLRLPHPDGRKAVRVEGGTYDPVTETVTIARFCGKANVKLVF